MTAFIFGILLNFLQASLSNDITEQLSIYVDNIRNNTELAENYWALTELVVESCKADNKVRKELNKLPSFRGKQVLLSTDCPNSQNKDDLQLKLKTIKDISLIEKIYDLAPYYLVTQTDSLLRENYYDTLQIHLEKSSLNDVSVFLKKVYNKSTVKFKEIPNSLTELFLYAVLFSYGSDIYLDTNNELEFASNLRDRFLLQNKKYSVRSSLGSAIVAFTLYSQNRYGELTSLHDKIIEQSLFPNTLERNRYINALAYSQYTIGRYDKSLELHRNIISSLGKYYNDQKTYQESIYSQGVNLFSLGKFHEAKEIFESLRNEQTSYISKPNLFNNLSICYFNLGEKNKYITLMLEALHEAEELEKYQVNLTILSNLFFFYTSIGDKTSAISYLKQAEELATTKNDTSQIANLHAFTGVFYWKNEKNTELAIREFKQAKSKFNSENNLFDYSKTLINLSQIYIETDSLIQAKEPLEELKILSISNSNRRNFLESMIGLMEIALLSEEFKKAESLLNEISQYPLDVLEFRTLVKYHTVKSEFIFNTSSPREAYASLRPVVNLVLDRARTSIDTQTGYWVQEQEYLDAFNTMLEMMMAMGYEHETIQLLDEIKSINDAALYNSPILRANKLSEENLALDRLLNDEITDLRSKYLNASTASARQSIEIDIEKLSAQREEILNNIRTEIPKEKLPVWAIQQSLKEKEAVLHFTEVGDYLYISLLNNQSVEIERIDFKSENKALFSDVADQLANSNTNLQALFEIYKTLKLDKLIASDTEKLVVIPDNYLYRIPLDVLPIKAPITQKSYGSTRFFIEQYHLQYYTSLYEYWTNSRNINTNLDYDFSVFAISDFSKFTVKDLPTLPFATQEARIIERTLDSSFSTNIYMENEATKQTFLEKVSQTKVVHIATHSEVSEQDPMFSTIYLNNETATGNNTALYAYELYDQELKSDLIMLNSCSSGSGEYLQGSGIMGINRALRYAGAKSLALNLWAVNDKVASEFAASFYEAINQGKNKSEAMRIAKLSLLSSGNANPHYWGAYMLIGNPSPIQQKPASTGFLLSMLVLLGVTVTAAHRMN